MYKTEPAMPPRALSICVHEVVDSMLMFYLTDAVTYAVTCVAHGGTAGCL